MGLYFSFWWSHIEKCWRWCLEAYSRTGGGNASHTYQWHWSLSRTAETAICTFFFTVVRKVRYVPTSSRLRVVLISRAVFGMSGPFLCPSAFKMAADWAGDQRKALLFCALVVIRKKRPFCCSQDLPPRTSSAMFYQASNHNALLPLLQGPGLQTLQALF